MGNVPEVLNGIFQHCVLQPCLQPELLGKGGVVDLKAVILPYRLAAPRTARGGRHGHGFEKSDIFST